MKDREAWHAAVHGVAKSWTRLNNNNKDILSFFNDTQGCTRMNQPNITMVTGLTKHGADRPQGKTHRQAPQSLGTLWPCRSGVTLEQREVTSPQSHCMKMVEADFPQVP